MSPADSLQFLDRYGVVILPALAVAEQIGLPLPAVPALLAVGALAAHGRSSIPLVLGAISVAALAIDFVWYELGRRRGARVLVRLCQLSLEADSWLRRAESTFARYGARSMLAAKFIPGLTTVMPPLAGVFAIPRGHFALCDLAGELLWAGTWLALGYFFSDAIVLIAAKASALGRMLGLVIVTALAGYILVKYGRRRLFLKKLRTALSRPRRSSGGSTPETTSRSSISEQRSTSRPHRTPSRGAAGWPPAPSTSMRSSSSALGMLCSTAPHPTTRRAPGWRLSCNTRASVGSVRSRADLRRGWP